MKTRKHRTPPPLPTDPERDAFVAARGAEIAKARDGQPGGWLYTPEQAARFEWTQRVLDRAVAS